MLARLLCAIFALVGLVPLALGVLVRTARVRTWAARETTTLLARELGISARFSVEVTAWPMTIGLTNLVVDASDGGRPFLEVERATVKPRLFSLFAGQLDAGDVEIVGPHIRAVVRDGELANLRYKLPAKGTTPSGPGPRASLASVAVTDAHLDLSVDGTRVAAREIDVDVSAEPGEAFEAAVRAGATRVVRVHPFVGRESLEDAVDEDVVCRLDARVRISPGEILVRRLVALGSADFDPDPGTAPSCQLGDDDWRRVELRLGAVRVGLPEGDGKPTVQGRVSLRVPAPLAHRFVPLAHVSGSIEADLDVDFDGRTPLPRATGRIVAERPGLDGKVFAKRIELELVLTGSEVRARRVQAAWADGKVTIQEVKLAPLMAGMPFFAGPIDVESVELAGLLRDLGVHPRAHVGMTIKEAHYDRIAGTLDPLSLDGPLTASVRGFEIYDRPSVEPARRHVFGVREGTVKGVFQVRPSGVVFSGFSLDLAGSHLRTTVGIGFEDNIDLEVAEGGVVDLADVSPFAQIPVSGTARISASMHGSLGHPKLVGEVAVQSFVFGGFAIGDVEQAKVEFEPLVLTLRDAKVHHGKSKAKASLLVLDFDHGDVIVDADVDTREAPHMDIRDFFEIFHFDKDPRWDNVSGVASGTAHVHYDLGGPGDRCGGGMMDVTTRMHVSNVGLFGESYDSGNVDMRFVWDDQAAGDAGMKLDLYAAELRKGAGAVLASGSVSHGGVVRVGAIATGLPIDRLDALGPAGKLFDGQISAIANVSGTLAQLEAVADVQVSRMRAGATTMPTSHLHVNLEPPATPPKVLGRTRCGNIRTPAFDRAEYDRDLSAGQFRFDGQLFGGQVTLSDVTMSRQRHATVAGKVRFDALDLGKLAHLVPGLAWGAAPPTGTLTAQIDVARLPLDQPDRADVTLRLERLEVERFGRSARLSEPSGPIVLRGNDLDVPDLRVSGRTKSGLVANVVAGGKIRHVVGAPELDVGVRVEPLDLSRLSADVPDVARAGGTVDASLRVTGPPKAPRYAGAAHVRKGEFAFVGSPLSLDGIDVDVEVGDGEVRVSRAKANIGSGTISATGRMPVHGLELGTAQATITLRGVRLPVADGVELKADADLQATLHPGDTGADALPDVRGTVSLTSFRYTRPIAMSVNLGQLTGRREPTNVETYDPNGDFVRFNLVVVSPQPLRFSNNLVDMQLEVVAPGIVLSGTNQRFGARGMLRILPDSKLTLRNSEFDVREGWVRFDDPVRIAPKVDVRAQTEYRRAGYAADTSSEASATTATGGAAGLAATSGQWRIQLHAHGDAEDLKVNLTSDPPLSQEDIVLLLTVGMTRAEVDRGLASTLGETVGLEALTSLTGADKAIKKAVPIIDEFRFGTGYSSRTGRTEPTVTVGKKVTDSVRANVTTGITENREVRSTVEWRLNRTLSVQGSYDNANDNGSSVVGNVGADLRWRLEFE